MSKISEVLSTGRQRLRRFASAAALTPAAARTITILLVGAVISTHYAHAYSNISAPEIDPGSAGAALAVLAGSMLVIRARLRKNRKP